MFDDAPGAILDADDAERDPSVKEAWTRIAVEMTLRRFGMGDPCLDGLSQLRLIDRFLPGVSGTVDAREHVNGTNYLIRRLRVWARRNRTGIAQSLWRRWLERTTCGRDR